MQKTDEIFLFIKNHRSRWSKGITAAILADTLNLNRSTASRYLNELVRAGNLKKNPGKPVRYYLNERNQSVGVESPSVRKNDQKTETAFGGISLRMPDEVLIGSNATLKPIIEKGMAALFYPDQGLNILLSGETGVGKSYIAEYLSKVVAVQPWNRQSAPFIAFNCANYAQNPELLMGHIFGIKKGAFTGAERDETGLVEQANHGILFLDEIHRLPPSGQEMLFYLIDKGMYRRLGETSSTRRAKLILIGATTETLESTLLPTLLRRFSLKLLIPPLRERTAGEREAFLSFFLKQEAKKMKVPLLIEDYCREAFLRYVCPGNIGQLKSDIQLSCARAFMRHLQQGTEKVTIQRNDLPSQVLSSLTENVPGKSSRHLVPSAARNDQPPIKNIYSELASIQNKSKVGNGKDPDAEHRMRLAINHYLQELHAISERRYETEPGWVRFINHDLLDALRESEFYFKDAFPFQYGTKQLIALGLHLESYRKQAGEKRRSALPGVPPASALYRKSAEKLADFLEKRIHLHLPEREKELLAHLLASTTSDTVETKNRVIVYLVTHGKSTASSMAEVTNYLLGNPVIHPVDMPLTEATVVTYKKVREHFAGLDRHTSILMLVDIGSLVTMGETLSKDTGLSIKSLANVNLPMLIEAGRKALIPGNSLDTVYEAAKSAYFALAPKRQLPESRHIDKQRLIVTICLTGEGTAQLLHDWLVDQIEPEDDDVAVRAIRIDPVSKDTSMLSSLQEQYRMIAIIGTFPVDFGAVPFIPALELLKDDGNARLGRLLELSRNHRSARTFDKVKKQLPQDRDEMWELAMTGLGKIVHYLNPHTFYQVTSGHFERLTTFYRWDQESELGMWMHLGSVAEKIFRNKMTGKEEPVFPDEDVNLPVTAEDHAMWDPLFHQLGKELQLRLSEPLRLSLIKLGKRQITA